MFRSLFQERPEVDTLRKIFQPQHKIKSAEDEITKFIAARDALQKIDKIIMTAACVDTLMWLSTNSYLGLLVNSAATLGIYLYATQYAQRAQHETEFQKQLHSLIYLYKNYTNAGPAITRDETFLKILTNIAPYVPTDDLMLWDLAAINAKDLSPQFMQILSQAPHRLQFAVLKEKNDFVLFQHDAANKAKLRKHANNFSGLFSQAIAEAKQVWYGPQDEDEIVNRLA